MIEPDRFSFADDGVVPNSRLPLLVYRQAVPADAAAIERLFAAHTWPPAWRNGVYPFHHFHSNSHEALGVARGSVRVQFGGPSGQVLAVSAGDVMVIPAGVGHCNRGASADLLIVGAYPAGAPPYDTIRADQVDRALVRRNLDSVALPDTDPVAGADRPLRRLWGG